MDTKYIDKEISMLARMEQLEAISQQGLDKLKEFRYLRDLAKGQSLPIANVVGQSEQFTLEQMKRAFDAGAWEHHLHNFDSWIKTLK